MKTSPLRFWCGLALLLVVAKPALGGKDSGTLDVYWPDVEGGAATLIISPRGESVFIDTGMPGGRDSERIYKIAKEIARLDHLDHLIITHFHIDHFGGAGELAVKLPIHHVHDNGIPPEDPDGNPDNSAFMKSIQPYREMKVRERTVIHPGDALKLAPSTDTGTASLRVRCLAAKQRFVEAPRNTARVDSPCANGRRKDYDPSDNANSVVMLVEFGDFRLFVGGDLTWNMEAELVCPANRVGRVDVYQVDHHGLDVSNNPVLVRSLAPTVAVMSNGTRKGCGAETFETLKSAPSIEAIYQIHRNLRVDSDNNTAPDYIANAEEKCDGNHIELRVDPAGKSYSIRIPAGGHTRSFRVTSKT